MMLSKNNSTQCSYLQQSEALHPDSPGESNQQLFQRVSKTLQTFSTLDLEGLVHQVLSSVDCIILILCQAALECMCSETTVPSSYFTEFQAHEVNFLGHSPHFNSSQVIKWLPCLSGIFCGVDLPPRSHALSASFDIRSQAFDRPAERDKPLPVIWGPAPAPCGRIACQTPQGSLWFVHPFSLKPPRCPGVHSICSLTQLQLYPTQKQQRKKKKSGLQVSVNNRQHSERTL